MRWASWSATLFLAACNSNVAADAAKCGVSKAQLDRAVEATAEMRPYSGRNIGRCDLTVDDARNVVIITPEIRQSVENLIAREKAEAKN